MNPPRFRAFIEQELKLHASGDELVSDLFRAILSTDLSCIGCMLDICSVILTHRRAQHHLHHAMARPPFHRVMDAS